MSFLDEETSSFSLDSPESTHQIDSTEEGRIFLGGSDGSLYELQYQSEAGWWTPQCKKTNWSSSVLSSSLSILVPRFMKWQSSDGILDIAVDRERGILFTLSEFGTITVYDLGENRDTMRRVCSVTLRQIADAMREAFKKEGKSAGFLLEVFEFLIFLLLSSPEHLKTSRRSPGSMYRTVRTHTT
jgi:hypothetical protein